MEITAAYSSSTVTTTWGTRAAESPDRQEDTRTEAHREHHRTRHREEHHPEPNRVQRALKHLLRDVRRDIKDELEELAEAGILDPQYAKDVKALLKEFRDDLQDVYQAAGRNRDFDPTALREGVGQAMADLTDGLAALRKARDGVATVPVEPPLPAPQDPPAEAPAVQSQPVQDQPVQAQVQLAFTAQLTVSFGLIADLQA